MSELIDNRVQQSTNKRVGSERALNPKHPERICWGCDKYCPATELRCGNGTIRTQHPVELFGKDWLQWELDVESIPPRATLARRLDDNCQKFSRRQSAELLR